MIKIDKLLLTIVLLSTTFSYAQQGGVGGGDSAELEFKAMGQGLAQRLTKDLGSFFPEVSTTAFSQAVKDTKVVMTSLELMLDGSPRDALNFPSEHKIEVNRQKWIKLTPAKKASLAFHEYLGIMGLEHEDYSISDRLLSRMGTSELLKLAGEASPAAEYQCNLFRLNPDDARIQENCDGGGYFVLTTRFAGWINEDQNPFTPSNDYHNSVCGDIWINIGTGISLDNSTSFHVQLSTLKPGKSAWNKRSPDQYSEFSASLYAPPQNFELTLTIQDRGFHLNKRRQTSYVVNCHQR